MFISRRWSRPAKKHSHLTVLHSPISAPAACICSRQHGLPLVGKSTSSPPPLCTEGRPLDIYWTSQRLDRRAWKTEHSRLRGFPRVGWLERRSTRQSFGWVATPGGSSETPFGSMLNSEGNNDDTSCVQCHAACASCCLDMPAQRTRWRHWLCYEATSSGSRLRSAK